MKIYKLLSLSLSALRREDETFLAFMYGQVWDEPELTYLKNADAKRTGVFFQSLIYFRVLQKCFIFLSESPKKAQAFFYAGTDNQIKALLPTVISMRDKGIACVAYLDRDVSCKEAEEIDDRMIVGFQFATTLIALILYFIKAPSLFFRLRKDGNNVGINKYFYIFCMAYAYIPYFLDLLSVIKPAFVIQSNDHSIGNRCLRLAAETLGIKTVYMQHASVSNLFPPLEFDYAFLDGEDALKKYVACRQSWMSIQRQNANVSNVTVFLSGQQKKIAITSSVDKAFCVGIGVNILDEFSCLKIILDVLNGKGVSCIVRTHPGQSSAFLYELGNYTTQNKYVQFLDSKTSSLSDFFGRCSILVAANTSLHLEAAIAGLPTYYQEFSRLVHKSDYYGFVKSGLSAHLPADIATMSVEEIMSLAISPEARLNAIRRYSESFGTPWQNREGELVSETLSRLIDGRGYYDIYAETDFPNSFMAVYRISDIKVPV
jgi:hypothetical protein